MRMQNNKPLVLVTGGAGLIGSRLMPVLRDKYRLVGLDLNPPEIGGDGAEWMQCDLTDDDSVMSVLQKLKTDFGDRIASVVHLAAYYDFSGEPSPLYNDLTVEGTRRLLRGLQDFAVEQFLFTSTLLVMQSAEGDEPIDASAPLEAEWDYPQSKLATEKLIAAERGEIPALILRLAGVYDEDGHSIPLAQQISRIFEKQWESYFFPGDKTHGQSFIHLDDTAECIRRAVACRLRLPPAETLLVGEEDVMSYEELQDALGELIHGKEWPTLRIPKSVAKAGAWVQNQLPADDEEAPFIKPWMIDLADQNYPVDIRRARELLHWAPQHTLRATLPEMILRLKRDPQAWYEMNGLPLPDHLRTESAGSGTATRS